MLPAWAPVVLTSALAISPDTADSTCPALNRVWRRHRYILPSLLGALVVCAWFVTWGDWTFFAPESFCRFYDAQARSLLAGRFDVPADAIGFEAFVLQGRTYGYFGIGPAVLRIPFVLLFGDLNGLTSRAMMMLACAMNVICAYGIVRALTGAGANVGHRREIFHSLFVICAALGSSNLFLMSRSFVFHEASMWAGAFALATAWAAIAYYNTRARTSLSFAGVCALFSFHCRPTVGAGALLTVIVIAVLVVVRRRTHPRALADVAIAAAFVVVTFVTFFGVNYAKFHTIDGIPVRYYQLYLNDPHRMEVTGGRQIHPENIPTTTLNYFGLDGLRFTSEFPWVRPNQDAIIVGNPAIDVVEPFSSIPASMPALTLLAVCGVVGLCWRRSSRLYAAAIPAVSLSLGGAVVLMTVGITERYLHDFYPALIVFGACGVSGFESPRWLRSKTALLTVLILASIWINASFGIVFQRMARWGVPPEKRAEFVHWQQMAAGPF